MKPKIITKEWLNKKKACDPSLQYVCNNNYIGLPIKDFLNKLMIESRFSDANWLLTRYFNKKQNIQYAIFAAEQVLNIFEEKYPDNKNPRNAIQAAKNYLKNPCKKTKIDAAAAYAAYGAAAYAAYDAVAYDAAANAAYGAAAYAAYDAAAYDAAAYAAAAYGANPAAKKEIYTKIINYGISLIKE